MQLLSAEMEAEGSEKMDIHLIFALKQPKPVCVTITLSLHGLTHLSETMHFHIICMTLCFVWGPY